MTLRSFGTARRFQVFGSALMLGALVLWMFPQGASAAVTGSVTPNSGLGDTGTVSVTASGFAQDGTLHTVFVLECEHGATDSSQCDANTGDGSLNSNTAGNYSNPAYTYYTLPNAIFGGFSAITCDATHLCDLVVIQDDYNNFSNPHVNLPITFAGGGATTTTTTTTVPATTTSTTATTVPSTTTTTTVPATTTSTTATTVPATTTTTTVPSTTTSTTATTVPATTTTTTPGATTTTSIPGMQCPPSHHDGYTHACFCIPQGRSRWSLGPFRYCKHHDDRHRDPCPCDPPRHRHGDDRFGSQGDSGSPGYNATNASYSGGPGQKLPDAGVPPAAPLMAICGFVILVAGTVLRRVVLHVPA